MVTLRFDSQPPTQTMKRKIMLGAGYFEYSAAARWFSRLWAKNVERNPVVIDHVAIISVGGKPPMVARSLDFDERTKLTVIDMSGNLGHVHQLLPGKHPIQKPHDFGGWSAGVLALALLAYNDEADLVFQEQDCLTFGPVIETMYNELGDGGMIYGKNKLMGAAQSLFLVRHHFIPIFVMKYLRCGPDRNVNILPEAKFQRLKEQFPGDVKQFSFPFDRDRPLDFGQPVWYGQKYTRAELLAMRALGLVEFNGEPPAGLFTSTP